MDERTKQLLALGREYYEKREFDKAQGYLEQVLERSTEGRYADVHNMLGVIHHDRGRLEQAQAAFEEALAINPNYTEAALNLAVTYNDLGRYEDAKRIYQATIARGAESAGALDPFVKGKIANLHAEVAQAYVDAGLPREAMHEYRKAVLLCPHFADLRVKLANLHRQLGDQEAARFELEEAIEARPNYVPARVALGVVMLALGDQVAAIAQWEAAVQIDPDNKAAQMYLRMARSAPASVPPGGTLPPPPQAAPPVASGDSGTGER
jgi:tetratricopeptide (TPR) repeat protein